MNREPREAEGVEAGSAQWTFAAIIAPIGVLVLGLNVIAPREGLDAFGLGLVVWGTGSLLVAARRS